MCDSIRNDAAETEMQLWQHNHVQYLYMGKNIYQSCMYVYTAAAKIIRTHHI